MTGNLIIFYEDYGDLIYQPKMAGQIELHRISKDLQILKIYFEELRLTNYPKDSYIESTTEIMLTNYPIEIEDLNELDGKTLEIENGWIQEEMFTMLSIHDGEPINKNQITFNLNKDGDFNIKWSGFWGAEVYDEQFLNLNIIAKKEKEIITPLCKWDKELIEIYRKE